MRGVCSGFLVAFDKFWNMVGKFSPFLLPSWICDRSVYVVISPRQAMVDVDETYREPLFGEALYHEKALTISRVCTHGKTIVIFS